MGKLVNASGGPPDSLIRDNLDGLMARVPPALLSAATILGLEWKQMLNHPGSGRFYGDHQASAPGEPPAPEFYNLQRSIHISEMPSPSPDVPSGVRVASDEPTAAMLEFGTRPRSGTQDHKKRTPSGRGRLGSRLGGIAPRPHARPSLTRALPKMNSVMVGQLSRGTPLGVTIR